MTATPRAFPLAHNMRLYTILGVPDFSSVAEVRAAYKTLALRYHPDKTLGDPALTEKYKEIRLIYEFLTNEEQKRQYDITLRAVRAFTNPITHGTRTQSTGASTPTTRLRPTTRPAHTGTVPCTTRGHTASSFESTAAGYDARYRARHAYTASSPRQDGGTTHRPTSFTQQTSDTSHENAPASSSHYTAAQQEHFRRREKERRAELKQEMERARALRRDAERAAARKALERRQELLQRHWMEQRRAFSAGQRRTRSRVQRRRASGLDSPVSTPSVTHTIGSAGHERVRVPELNLSSLARGVGRCGTTRVEPRSAVPPVTTTLRRTVSSVVLGSSPRHDVRATARRMHTARVAMPTACATSKSTTLPGQTQSTTATSSETRSGTTTRVPRSATRRDATDTFIVQIHSSDDVADASRLDRSSAPNSRARATNSSGALRRRRHGTRTHTPRPGTATAQDKGVADVARLLAMVQADEQVERVQLLETDEHRARARLQRSWRESTVEVAASSTSAHAHVTRFDPTSQLVDDVPSSAATWPTLFDPHTPSHPALHVVQTHATHAPTSTLVEGNSAGMSESHVATTQPRSHHINVDVTWITNSGVVEEETAARRRLEAAESAEGCALMRWRANARHRRYGAEKAAAVRLVTMQHQQHVSELQEQLRQVQSRLARYEAVAAGDTKNGQPCVTATDARKPRIVAVTRGNIGAVRPCSAREPCAVLTRSTPVKESVRGSSNSSLAFSIHSN